MYAASHAAPSLPLTHACVFAPLKRTRTRATEPVSQACGLTEPRAAASGGACHHPNPDTGLERGRGGQVCFRRNVHGRQLGELRAAAEAWEPAPPAFPLLDVAGLLRGEARPLVAGPPCRPGAQPCMPSTCCACSSARACAPVKQPPSPLRKQPPRRPGAATLHVRAGAALGQCIAVPPWSSRGVRCPKPKFTHVAPLPQGIMEVEMDEGAADAPPPADAPPAYDAPPQPTSRSRALTFGIRGGCGVGQFGQRGCGSGIRARAPWSSFSSYWSPVAWQLVLRSCATGARPREPGLSSSGMLLDLSRCMVVTLGAAGEDQTPNMPLSHLMTARSCRCPVPVVHCAASASARLCTASDAARTLLNTQPTSPRAPPHLRACCRWSALAGDGEEEEEPQPAKKKKAKAGGAQPAAPAQPAVRRPARCPHPGARGQCGAQGRPRDVRSLPLLPAVQHVSGDQAAPRAYCRQAPVAKT